MEYATRPSPLAGKDKPGNDNARIPDDIDMRLTDPVTLGNILLDVSERAQPLLRDFFEKYEFDMEESLLDPLHIREACLELMQRLMSDPGRLAEMQIRFWQDWAQLWQTSAIRFMGGEAQEIYRADQGDRRFKSPLWDESAIFAFIKQSYLLTARWIEHTVNSAEGLDERTKKKLDFSTRQFLNAMAPTNFLLTNPEALQETLNTQGENLLKGLENLLEDMERGRGQLRISTTDHRAFEVGRNLAVTPGKIVCQNEMMQLIQYEASTEKVFKRPLLVVPPWINKYYILDLQPENSFIKWLVDQGHTVFVVSWVNPDRSLGGKSFDDYMQDGILAALDRIEKITGEKDCNAIGYCLGGTLLAMTMAWLADRGQADRIAAATFLTTLIDFDQAGEMKLFIDDEQLEMLDRQMKERGILDAAHMRRTFSMLRANDMIWSFVVNNYLMGREPFPFDLLYWNDDATNMPAAMHSFYLRRLYRDNLLIRPGGVTIGGTPIDIAKIKTPSYFLSTREDHIAPWQATYAATHHMQGENVFTLSASGHVAGVVNPPVRNKYCYWSAQGTPPSPDDWLSSAQSHDGSWWPHWQQWAEKHTGGETAARKPGGRYKTLEDAPGSYVRMKAD